MNFFLAADHRIHLSFLCKSCQIPAVLFQCLSSAALLNFLFVLRCLLAHSAHQHFIKIPKPHIHGGQKS